MSTLYFLFQAQITATAGRDVQFIGQGHDLPLKGPFKVNLDNQDDISLAFCNPTYPQPQPGNNIELALSGAYCDLNKIPRHVYGDGTPQRQKEPETLVAYPHSVKVAPEPGVVFVKLGQGREIDLLDPNEVDPKSIIVNEDGTLVFSVTDAGLRDLGPNILEMLPNREAEKPSDISTLGSSSGNGNHDSSPDRKRLRTFLTSLADMLG